MAKEPKKKSKASASANRSATSQRSQAETRRGMATSPRGMTTAQRQALERSNAASQGVGNFPGTAPTKKPTSDPTKSARPTARPSDLADGAAVNRGNRAREREEREREGLRAPKKKMGGGAMKTKKYAKGGMARGCGAATKGGKYSRSG